jgi:hypothetical protein
LESFNLLSVRMIEEKPQNLHHEQKTFDIVSTLSGFPGHFPVFFSSNR